MLTRAQKARRRKSHHALWFAPQMAMLEARTMLSASDGRSSQTFAFIDSAVGDEAAIVASLPSTPGFHSVVLDAGRDELSQITEALHGQSDVAAIHLYSHGFAGGLQLGGTRLDVGSLSLEASQISGWASALTPDADILLYGCDVAAGDAGALFLTDIAALTGADVAASTDPTGSPSLGGNWTLEAASGPIAASSIPLAFDGLLAPRPISGTAGVDVFTISGTTLTRVNAPTETLFKSDALTIDGQAGNDTITFSTFTNTASTTVDGGPGEDEVTLNPTVAKTLKLSYAADVLKADLKTDVAAVQTLPMTNVERIVAKGTGNTLDLSALTSELLIQVVGPNKTEILKNTATAGQAPTWSKIFTATGFQNVIGSETKQDFFVIGKGFTLDGKIDGRGGNNVLSYAATFADPFDTSATPRQIISLAGDSSRIVAIDTSKGTATGFKAAVPPAISFSNIKAFIGGPKDDSFTGTAAADIFIGGAGADTFTGAGGADKLTGGVGDDTYVFKAAAELANVTLSEKSNEGTDTLDLSAVLEGLTVDFRPQALTGVAGISISASTGQNLQNVANVEKFKGGKGANVYKFHDAWGRVDVKTATKLIQVDIDETANAPAITPANAAKAKLDFSDVTYDLTFVIKTGGQVVVTSAPQVYENLTTKSSITYTYQVVTTTGIKDIIGGKGNNTYKFDTTGIPTTVPTPALNPFPTLLSGTITPGAPTQLATKSNTLDYSASSKPIEANFSVVNVTFTTTPTATLVPPPPAPAQLAPAPRLPVQEKWTFAVNAKSGTMIVGKGLVPFTDTNLAANSEKIVVEQELFKKALSDVLKRTDFTVKKTLATSVTTSVTTWTVLFSAPNEILETVAPAVAPAQAWTRFSSLSAGEGLVQLAPAAAFISNASSPLLTSLEDEVKTLLESYKPAAAGVVAAAPIAAKTTTITNVAGTNTYEIKYQSSGTAWDGKLAVTDPTAAVTDPTAARGATISAPVPNATYKQNIDLPADWQGDTFRLNFFDSPVNYPAGSTAGTPGTPYLIRKGSEKADIVAALGQFVYNAATNPDGILAIAPTVTTSKNVLQTAGSAARPWIVTLVSKDTNTPVLSKAADLAAFGPITPVRTGPTAPATAPYRLDWTVAGTIQRDQKWAVTVGSTEYFFFAGSGGTLLTPAGVAAGLAAKINGSNGLTATSVNAVMTVTRSTDPGTPKLTILPPNPIVAVAVATEPHTIYTQTITLQGEAVVLKNERAVEFGLKIVSPVLIVPTVTPARGATDVGQKAEDQTWEVSTQAVGGTFKLDFTFKNKTSTDVPVSVLGIPWNSAPNDIQAKIQAQLNPLYPAARSAGTLDVPPKVFVSGMGTTAFPWRITFGNMGSVALTADTYAVTPLTNALPSGATQILVNTVPGVAGGLGDGLGNVATEMKISNVIGSGKNDWIYGVRKASLELVTITEAAVLILPDKQTLQVPGDIDLVTGQAVLYRQTVAGKDTINGLVKDAIYFVRFIQKVPSSSPGGKDTQIKFYATREESLKSGVRDLFSSALKLSKELDNTEATHQLFTVPVADGAVSNDRIIAANGNLGGALFGGTGKGLGNGGDDTLVGGAGADFISGNDGDDSLFGDGSHVAVADNNGVAIGGVDTLSGGADDDKVFGLAGDDTLSGGAGNDYLVGGAGSDVVDGGAGNDTLAVIEKGKSTDYDILKGGEGSDQYVLKADWGVANIVETGDGTNTIDLTDQSANYVHVLSNSTLYSTPGALYNSQTLKTPAAGRKAAVYDTASAITQPDGSVIKFGTALESLTGTKASPGQVLTQWGFGFHQEAIGSTLPGFSRNAVLTAISAPQPEPVTTTAVPPTTGNTYAAFSFLLRVDRGDGAEVYNVTVPASTYADPTALSSAVTIALKAAVKADPWKHTDQTGNGDLAKAGLAVTVVRG